MGLELFTDQQLAKELSKREAEQTGQQLDSTALNAKIYELQAVNNYVQYTIHNGVYNGVVFAKVNKQELDHLTRDGYIFYKESVIIRATGSHYMMSYSGYSGATRLSNEDNFSALSKEEYEKAKNSILHNSFMTNYLQHVSK